MLSQNLETKPGMELLKADITPNYTQNFSSCIANKLNFCYGKYMFKTYRKKYWKFIYEATHPLKKKAEHVNFK
jgi:hypothetical protein